MKNPWILALLITPVWAQSPIAPPVLGFVEDSARALRPAYGVSGNFILGPAVAGAILNQAFSGSVGLLKTDSSLAAFDPKGRLLVSMKAPAGPALFAFSPSGGEALAYLPSSQTLIEWNGSAFTLVSIESQSLGRDDVLAIAFPNSSQASLIVQRPDALWQLQLPLDSRSALSQSALPGIHAPVLTLPSGDLVYSSDGGIVVRRPNGLETHVPASLPAKFSLQQMNQYWVELADLDSSARYAIRATPGREAFYRLPEQSK